MRTRNVVIVGVLSTFVLMCLCAGIGLFGVVGTGGAFVALSPSARAWFTQGGDPDQAAAEVAVADAGEAAKLAGEGDSIPSTGNANVAEQPAPTPTPVVIVVTDTVASQALGAQIVAEAQADAAIVLAEAEEEAETIRMGAAALLSDCEKDSQATAWQSQPHLEQEWQLGSPEETCWTEVEWRLDVCPFDPVENPLEASEACWGIFILGPGEYAVMPFDTGGSYVILGPTWNPDNRHEMAQENVAVGMYARWAAESGNPGITVRTNSVPEGTEVKYVDENGVTHTINPETDWPESVHYQAIRLLELALPVEDPVEAYP